LLPRGGKRLVEHREAVVEVASDVVRDDPDARGWRAAWQRANRHFEETQSAGDGEALLSEHDDDFGVLTRHGGLGDGIDAGYRA
jgi:hypothetical protein